MFAVGPRETVPPYLSNPPNSGQSEARGVAPRSSPFWKTLSGLGRALDGGEALTAHAAQAGPELAAMSPAALIALQCGIYRYTEVVDLASKLVDRATGAVKTTLQSQ